MPLACYHTATGTDCCQSLPAVREDAAAAAVVAAAVVADAAVVTVDGVAAAAVVAAAAAVSLPSRMQWRTHHHEYHGTDTLIRGVARIVVKGGATTFPTQKCNHALTSKY